MFTQRRPNWTGNCSRQNCSTPVTTSAANRSEAVPAPPLTVAGGAGGRSGALPTAAMGIASVSAPPGPPATERLPPVSRMPTTTTRPTAMRATDGLLWSPCVVGTTVILLQAGPSREQFGRPGGYLSQVRALPRALPRALSNVVGPLLAAVALITAGYLYLRFGSGNLPRLASPDMRAHVDFDSFWRSAVALRNHTDLYRTGSTLPNLDPPVLAVLLAPLAGLDALTAYRAFALLNAVLAVGSVIIMADRAKVRPGWAMIAVAAVAVSSPLQGTVALGQVYGLLT